jgi:hypothetical protein
LLLLTSGAIMTDTADSEPQFATGLPADQSAAAVSSIVASLEAALRASACRDSAMTGTAPAANLARIICRNVGMTLIQQEEQQQGRQMWPGSDAEQQQLQLHSLLLSCAKVVAAASVDSAAGIAEVTAATAAAAAGSLIVH